MTRASAFLLLLAAVACATSAPATPSTSPQSQSAAASAQAPGGEGTVEKHSFASASLGVDKEYFVWLPPGYATSERRYPLVIMLHGLGGDETNWLERGELAAAAEKIGLQAVVVMPDGDASFYADFVRDPPYDDCLNGKSLFGGRYDPAKTCVKTARYESYITKDLIAEAEARFRLIPERGARAIGGVSMGGFGALVLAMRHKDLFASVASHSGVNALLYVGPHPYEQGKVVLLDDVSIWGMNIEPLGGWVRGIFGPDLANWKAHDPVHLARQLRPGELAIYLECGTADELNLQDGCLYLHDLLGEAGIEHVFNLVEGGRHNFSMWRETIDDSLGFHARAFAAAGY